MNPSEILRFSSYNPTSFRIEFQANPFKESTFTFYNGMIPLNFLAVNQLQQQFRYQQLLQYGESYTFDKNSSPFLGESNIYSAFQLQRFRVRNSNRSQPQSSWNQEPMIPWNSQIEPFSDAPLTKPYQVPVPPSITFVVPSSPIVSVKTEGEQQTLSPDKISCLKSINLFQHCFEASPSNKQMEEQSERNRISPFQQTSFSITPNLKESENCLQVSQRKIAKYRRKCPIDKSIELIYSTSPSSPYKQQRLNLSDKQSSQSFDRQHPYSLWMDDNQELDLPEISNKQTKNDQRLICTNDLFKPVSPKLPGISINDQQFRQIPSAQLLHHQDFKKKKKSSYKKPPLQSASLSQKFKSESIQNKQTEINTTISSSSSSHHSYEDVSAVLAKLSQRGLDSTALLKEESRLKPFLEELSFEQSLKFNQVMQENEAQVELLKISQRVIESSFIHHKLTSRLSSMPIAQTKSQTLEHLPSLHEEVERQLLLSDIEVRDETVLSKFDFSQVRHIVSRGKSLRRKENEDTKFKANSKFHNMNKLLMYNILNMFQPEILINVHFNQEIKDHLCYIAKNLKTLSKRSSNKYQFDYFSREHYHVLFLKITKANKSKIASLEKDRDFHAKCFHINLAEEVTDFELSYLNLIKAAFFRVFLTLIQEDSIIDDNTNSKQNLRRQYCLKAIAAIKRQQKGEILVRF